MDLNSELVEGNYSRIPQLLKELFCQTTHFPAFCLIDLNISQISNFIRISKFNEALQMLISFANQIPKLFFDSEDELNNYNYSIKDLNDTLKPHHSNSKHQRVVEVRTMDIENVIDVLINFLMIILTRQLSDKKYSENAIEKIIILSQHNWPQYSSLVDDCFRHFQSNTAAFIPSFRENIFQNSLIEEFSGLKHRSPNIKFYLTADRKELPSPAVQQIFLEQMQKSRNELPTLFYWKFILNSYMGKH